MSGYDDFILDCCNRHFLVKRYKTRPYLPDVISEEFKKMTCPVCGQTILERIRVVKKRKSPNQTKTVRLSGNSANFYLAGLDYKEIYNDEVEKGSKDLFNWFYGLMNRRYDLNDKPRDLEIVVK